MDLKLVNKLKNHKISFHQPHRHHSTCGVEQKKHDFLQSIEKVFHLEPHSVLPPSNHSLALDMFTKDPSTYLCASISNKSTCLNDCHLLGAIKKLRQLVINFHSIRNKFNEIEVLLESINPDVIIGAESWLNDEIFSS